jgi:hypothetical protein
MHKNYPQNYFSYLFHELDRNERMEFEYQLIHQKEWMKQMIIDRYLIQELKNVFESDLELT